MAALAANDDQNAMAISVAKTKGLQRKDANDNNSPAGDGTAEAGSTARVAALKPAR